ncbi:MAG: hypothetical protein C7N36_13955, partial [Bacteroidetes bacterium]
NHITINPAVLFGRPTIRNMRYPVAMLLDLLSGGMTRTLKQAEPACSRSGEKSPPFFQKKHKR